MLKPAEQTPLTRAAPRRADRSRPGCPTAWSTSSPASARPPARRSPRTRDVDKVAFTGSTEVGKLIVQAAAGNLKKVTLELGGKSPNIVFADADLEAAIPGAANAIFFNHGQCCCAGSRLYVEQKIFDEVVDGRRRPTPRTSSSATGSIPTPQMGPLVSAGAARPGHRLPASPGRQEGAATRRRRRAGRRHAATSSSRPCSTDTSPDMKVVREEIFGPVVAASPFKDVDEVIAPAANDTDYGLAAGIWTKDISKAHALAKKLRAGTVWINCYNVFDAALPFGGYKQSGWGREMGHEVLELYTEVKSVCAQTLDPGLRARGRRRTLRGGALWAPIRRRSGAVALLELLA